MLYCCWILLYLTFSVDRKICLRHPSQEMEDICLICSASSDIRNNKTHLELKMQFTHSLPHFKHQLLMIFWKIFLALPCFALQLTPSTARAKGGNEGL